MASRSATRRRWRWTISTSPSRRACPTGCSGRAATPRSRISPSAPGVGVLDDTAQSLFADVDNDGDRGPRARRLAPSRCCSSTTARAASPIVAGCLPVLRGRCRASLTSIAMGDYDRDGFLDLYLCVYSYFFGAAEDKAGYARAVSTTRATVRRACSSATTGMAVSSMRHDEAGLDGERSLSLRGGVGRLRWRRLAGPAGRERFRHQESLSQPWRAAADG